MLKNPESIILKNKYYPHGLLEEDIYNYYIKNKNNILKETNGKKIALFIIPELNKYIVKRKISGESIKLSPSNYESIISGRTISLGIEMERRTNYLVIDIDPGKSITRMQLIEDTKKIIKSSLMRMFTNYKIINTSRGFHLNLFLKTPISIQSGNLLLNKHLYSEFENQFHFGGTPPKPNQIKLDLAPNKIRGVHAFEHILNRNGLKCMDITNSFEAFRFENAILKGVI